MPIVLQWPIILVLLIASSHRIGVESKVFERCELATLLLQQHHLDIAEVAQWVCIANHSSGLNTAAHATSSTGGSHGLFQISDVYWCSPPGEGTGCNLSCQQLRDEDITDDLSCIKHIYDEHQRIFGDGYTAWKAYQQNCKHKATSYIQGCVLPELKESAKLSTTKGRYEFRGQFFGNSIQDSSPHKPAKVYERCELARELHSRHEMPMQQIPTWVCIAEHESRFNTAAVGRLNADGSADHGLFQISDLYWCSHDRYSTGGGKACGLPCSKLLDNDITDDVHCIKKIHSEHTAISGDGFSAWTVYEPYCQNQRYDQIANCFQSTHSNFGKEIYDFQLERNQTPGTTKLTISKNNPFLKQSPALEVAANRIPNNHKFIFNKNNPFFKQIPSFNGISKYPASGSKLPSSTRQSDSGKGRGKIYKKCELAQELYRKHHMPLDQIAKWVCIARHESSFNTAAVGHLNTDGSADHGLFQISDLYWCSHDEYGGKACNIHCDKFLDSDISDDVKCIKIIHEEHTRISGDGFNAWTVYQPHCRQIEISHIKECFTAEDLEQASKEIPTSNSKSFIPHRTKPSEKGKIYKKCELAQELLTKESIPMEQIPTWVCIAEHVSSYNTGAVGHLNRDGSLNHGIFQISDLYWCSQDQGGGKACNIPCERLLDSDLTDDIKCIQTIYEEHSRISGNGFDAWPIYKTHCQNQKIGTISSCFTPHQLTRLEKQHDFAQEHKNTPLQQEKSSYSQNPFLRGFKLLSHAVVEKPSKADNFKLDSTDRKPKYFSNPFLPNAIATSESEGHETVAQASTHANSSKVYNQRQNGPIQTESSKEHYQKNPFLNRSLKTTSRVAGNKIEPQSKSFKNNPFLAPHKIVNTAKPAPSAVRGKTSSLQASRGGESFKNYLNSSEFRTTTTTKPRTTSARPSLTITKKTTEKPTTRKFTVGSSSTTPKPFTVWSTKRVTDAQTKESAKHTTTWSWVNERHSTQLPKITAATTTKPHRATTISATTKSPKSANIKQIQNYQTLTTPSPLRTPTTPQIRNQNSTNNKALKHRIANSAEYTTLKPEKTTWSWRSEQKSTTANSFTTTTENWRKWDKITTTELHKTTSNTRNTMKSSTTTKPNTNRLDGKKWVKVTTEIHNNAKVKTDRTTQNRVEPTTWKPPLTSTENWRKLGKSTTKAPNATAKYNGLTSNWENKPKSNTTATNDWKKWDRSTTKVPTYLPTKSKATPATKFPTSTEIWRKWDKLTTTKSYDRTTWSWKTEQKSTTIKPLTSNENGRKLDKVTSTKSPERTTWNWKNEHRSTTIEPTTSSGQWRKWDKATTTTPKAFGPTISNWRSTTTAKPTTAKSTKATTTRTAITATAKATPHLGNYKVSTTKRPHNNENLKSTTFAPYIGATRPSPHKTTVPTQSFTVKPKNGFYQD